MHGISVIGTPASCTSSKDCTDRRSPLGNDWQPWAWCNLGRNPFGEMTRDERADLAVVNVDAIAGQLHSDFSAVQLIGACGDGKTTHLLHLAAMLNDAAYVYLPEDGCCPAIPHARPLLIDEAQRLPRGVRRRVFDSGLPLVLATHRELNRPLQRAGYNVTTEHIGTRTDAALIGRAMNRRLTSCRLTAGDVPQLSVADADWLAARFGSDLRAIEGFLYDQVQRQAFGDDEMRFIDSAR